ncbi:MAG: hypothetical protein ACFFAU_00480 [Candidatus Hodarchaeota archaeon]
MTSFTTIGTIDTLIFDIEHFFDSIFTNRLRTLPVKIKKRNQNTIVTWNIFPTNKVNLDDIFPILIDKINNNFENINGEIIKLRKAEGIISDTGNQEFQIIKSNSWEIYLYKPEIFMYIRLSYESRLSNPNDAWLSIDIDITEESAWFVD